MKRRGVCAWREGRGGEGRWWVGDGFRIVKIEKGRG